MFWIRWYLETAILVYVISDTKLFQIPAKLSVGRLGLYASPKIQCRIWRLGEWLCWAISSFYLLVYARKDLVQWKPTFSACVSCDARIFINSGVPIPASLRLGEVVHHTSLPSLQAERRYACNVCALICVRQTAMWFRMVFALTLIKVKLKSEKILSSSRRKY